MGLFDIIGDLIEDAGKHIENTVDLVIGKKDLQGFIEDGVYIPLDRAQEWNNNWNPEDDVDKFASTLKIKQDYIPEAGDVLGVERTGYIHWAIYAGDREVIHFYKQPGKEPLIQKTYIYDFQRLRFLGLEFHQGKIFALNVKLLQKESFLLKDVNDADETLRIAESRIGHKDYLILLNNCGDFAFECKFGHNITFEDQLRHSKYRIYFTS